MKNIDIFISSTFCDMQSERDYIRKHIIPQLNNEITKYGIHVNAIDLRWGINNALEISEEAKESKSCIYVCKQYSIPNLTLLPFLETDMVGSHL